MCARARYVSIIDRLKQVTTDSADPVALITSGAVWVNGSIITNPRARVPADAAVTLHRPKALRGAKKLTAAIRYFGASIDGAIAVDVGASTGGFTQALLAAGTARVYAVDVGYGQLLGSFRQDPRVVVRERTNLAALDTSVVPLPVDVVTIDVSYVSLATSLPQLENLDFAEQAQLFALVKPMYELGLQQPPETSAGLDAAVGSVLATIDALPWERPDVLRSPVLTSHGNQEFFVHAYREERRTP